MKPVFGKLHDRKTPQVMGWQLETRVWRTIYVEKLRLPRLFSDVGRALNEAIS